MAPRQKLPPTHIYKQQYYKKIFVIFNHNILGNLTTQYKMHGLPTKKNLLLKLYIKTIFIRKAHSVQRCS
jgi:hypothetical protein